MAGTYGVGGDEKCGGEGDIDQGVRRGVCAAGGASEIDAGRVIHRADVPDGGEESFEGLTCAAEGAECKSESGEKKRACAPRKEAGEIAGEEQPYAGASAGEGGDRETS